MLVRGDLQKSIGETQGPVCRTESIFIVISIAIYQDLEVSRGKSDELVGRRNQPESTGNGRNPNTIKTRTSQSQISRDEQSRRIQVQVQ